MSLALRDARLPHPRAWLERAYGEWLRELGARSDDLLAAGSQLAALLGEHAVEVFVFERDGRYAGFAIVRTLSPTARRLDEFYIVVTERRLGVGREAARLLFNRFVGEWEIVTLQRDVAALGFWRSVLPRYAARGVSEQRLAGEVRQRFSSKGAR